MLIKLLIEHPSAALNILRHTPAWIWLLLAGLIALGISQWRNRQASLARVTALPIAMLALSLLGLVTAFARSGTLPAALGSWLASFALVWLLLGRLRAASGARFSPGTRRFDLPGSPWPLLLILGIFALKYTVGIELAMQPQAAAHLPFALGVAALYGALSGVFIARTAALWRLARRH